MSSSGEFNSKPLTSIHLTYWSDGTFTVGAEVFSKGWSHPSNPMPWGDAQVSIKRYCREAEKSEG
jgi:hypothetical protein